MAAHVERGSRRSTEVAHGEFTPRGKGAVDLDAPVVPETIGVVIDACSLILACRRALLVVLLQYSVVARTGLRVS